MSEETFWNGERCEARKVTAVVAEWDEGTDPPHAWWRPYVGDRRDAVEVTYNGETFYLDDQGHEHEPILDEKMREFFETHGGRGGSEPAGQAWAKVTTGHGSPAYGHSSLKVVLDSVEPRRD